MSRTASLLLGVLCLGLAGAGVVKTIRAASTSPPVQPTELKVSPPTSEFGDVTSENTLWAAFTVTNPFNTALTIEDVSKSCSCVESDVATRELAAGASTTLRVGWQMLGKRGPVRETVALRYRVGGQVSYSFVYLSAAVQPRATFSPVEVHFGRATDATEQTVEFRAERPGVDVLGQEVVSPAAAVVATILPGGRSVAVRYDPTATVPNGVRQALHVKVTGFDTPWVEVPIVVVSRTDTN